MSKQICVKATDDSNNNLTQMFKEAKKYLENIGFFQTPLISITDKDSTVRTVLFSQGHEKVIMEYKKEFSEEVLKLVFNPLEIKFIYDILLMRFNQLADQNKDKVFIYNK